MHRFTATVLLFVLFGAVHGFNLAKSHVKGVRDFPSNKMIEKRQANCSFPDDYPQACETAFENIGKVETRPPEDVNVDTVATYLDDFCTTECVEPLVRYFTGLDEPGLVTYYNNVLCGRSDNQYCDVLYYENMIYDSIDCLQTGTACNSSCESAQQTVVNDWGCCAAGYYVFLGATCDVGAGDPCDGLVDAGIVNRIGLGLVTIFGMGAAFANAVLL